MNQAEQEAGYLKYLPPIFSDRDQAEQSFLAGMLKVFEHFFTGRPETAVPLDKLPTGLSFPAELAERVRYDVEAKRLILRGELTEEDFNRLKQLAPNHAVYQKALTDLYQLSRSIRFLLDQMDSYLDPQKMPEEFIEWLAGRLGFRLGNDWDLKKKRAVLAAVFPLYRIRGTRTGLEEYLRIFTGRKDLRVVDEHKAFQVEVEGASQVEADAAIEGLPPYFFVVELEYPPDPVVLKTKMAELKEFIEREKPAHTRYQIRAVAPSLRVEEQSTVEQDTLLWEWTERRYPKEEGKWQLISE